MTGPRRNVPGLTVALGVWAVGMQTHELFATVGGWACAALVVVDTIRQPPQWREALRSWWPLVAFLGWSLVVPTLAGTPPTGTGLARLSDWLLLPVAARAFVLLSPQQLQRVIAATAVTLVISCVVAGAQHFGAWPPLSAFDSLEWTRVPFARVYEPVPGVEGRFMGGGLLFHRLKFANLTAMLSALSLAFGLAQKGTVRVVAIALAALGLVSIAVFPFARAALIAAVVGFAAVFLLSVPRRSTALALTAGLFALVALIVVLSPGARERFVSATTSGGSGERGALFASGVAAVEAHPWVGLGPGRFRPSLYAEADAPAQVMEHPGKAHNQFLSIAAETGVPGALLFLALLGWLAAAFWRARAAAGSPASRRDRFIPSGVEGSGLRVAAPGNTSPPSLDSARDEALSPPLSARDEASVLRGASTIGPLAALVVFMVLALTHDPLFHAEFSLGFVLIAGFGLSNAQKPV